MAVKISVSVEVRKTYHRATFYWRPAYTKTPQLHSTHKNGSSVKYGKQMGADAVSSGRQPPGLYS